MELFEILADTPWLLTGSVFVLSLLVGSFLNVVIYRLPIMLDRQWRAQAEEMLRPESVAAALQPPAQPADSRSACPAPPPAPYNLVTPRSTCPHCNAPIKAHQNIPVLSYLLLGGKCANCKGKISARYPIVELVTARPLRGGRLALRLALADGRGADLHVGARGAHGDRPRSPGPARRHHAPAALARACCSASRGIRASRRRFPWTRDRRSSALPPAT